MPKKEVAYPSEQLRFHKNFYDWQQYVECWWVVDYIDNLNSHRAAVLKLFNTVRGLVTTGWQTEMLKYIFFTSNTCFSYQIKLLRATTLKLLTRKCILKFLHYTSPPLWFCTFVNLFAPYTFFNNQLRSWQHSKQVQNYVSNATQVGCGYFIRTQSTRNEESTWLSVFELVESYADKRAARIHSDSLLC